MRAVFRCPRNMRRLSLPGLRPRAPWPFAGALLALFLALAWPLGELAHESFAAHMAQHMLLIGVAAPLLVLSRFTVPALRGASWLGAVARTPPATAFALHAVAIWAGHAPRVIRWTIEYGWVHALEHVALLGTAALFWWTLASRRQAYGAAALWTLATLLHTGLLGALLTFSPRVLYRGYSLEDQQLAGLVMWIPGGLCYLAAGLAFAAAWLGARSAPAGASKA